MWATTRLRESETTIKIKFAFFRGGVGRGAGRKTVQNAISHGKRHDNKILKVVSLLSRNFVVMAQAPNVDMAMRCDAKILAMRVLAAEILCDVLPRCENTSDAMPRCRPLSPSPGPQENTLLMRTSTIFGADPCPKNLLRLFFRNNLTRLKITSEIKNNLKRLFLTLF